MFKELFIISLFLLLSPACVDQIDFSTNRGELDQLVIDGRIVELMGQDLNHAKITVQKLFNFEESSRSMVSVEKVSISNGTQTLELPQTVIGTYEINFGTHTYDLNENLQHSLYVKTLDGREYASTHVYKSIVSIPSELALEVVPTAVIDSFSQTTFVDQALLSITTPLIDMDDNSLLWEATQTYQVSTTQARKCYVTEQISTAQIMLLDTRDLNLQQVNNHFLFQTPVSRKFREGIYFTIRQIALDKAITTNLRKINVLLSQTNTLYNDPLNRLQSNIKNIEDSGEDVNGFFYVSQAVDIRLKVDSFRTYCAVLPAQGGTDLEADCNLHPITRQPYTGSDRLCCDCRTVPGSTTVKPEWWE